MSRIRPAIVSVSPLGTRKPLTPSSTVSANPPDAVAMTGTPLTMASIATSPSGSAQRDQACPSVESAAVIYQSDLAEAGGS